MGPDHPHRRVARDLHEDRLEAAGGQGVQEHVLDLPRLLDLHEGQGSARRPLHHQPDLRHLRRQPRHVRLLRAEHGLRGQAAADRRVDRQPRRGRRIHVRPQHLPGEPGLRGLLREDGAGDQPRRLGEGQGHRGAARGDPRLQDHRRHPQRLQPVRGRVLPRGPAGQPVDARDVLPDGGPPRPPVDALSGRRRHDADDPAVHRLPHPPVPLRRVHEARRADARRRLRLLVRGAARVRGGRPAPRPARLLGQLPGPGALRLPVPHDGGLGPQDVRDARRGRRRQAAHDEPRRHQPRHQHPARVVVLQGLGGRRAVRDPATRSATRSGRATRGTSTRTPSRRSATSTTSTRG